MQYTCVEIAASNLRNHVTTGLPVVNVRNYATQLVISRALDNYVCDVFISTQASYRKMSSFVMLARTPQKMHTATSTSAIGVTQPSQRKMRSLVLLARNLQPIRTATSIYAIGVTSACALDKLDSRIGAKPHSGCYEWHKLQWFRVVRHSGCEECLRRMAVNVTMPPSVFGKTHNER